MCDFTKLTDMQAEAYACLKEAVNNFETEDAMFWREFISMLEEEIEDEYRKLMQQEYEEQYSFSRVE
ncbi:MAG: hypothetical protein KDH96_07520 [Candidatus Riesia sp.]|nr:hypothetical protein [Candidatus Riesia sp.]